MPRKPGLTEAVEACTRLCRRLGWGPVDPVVLHVSVHISVRLHPRDLVARIVDADDGEATPKVARELDVARHLVAQAAPIVPPSVTWPAGPHLQDGFVVTLWTHVPHVAADEENDAHVALAAGALLRVHEALADYRGALPNFWDKADSCARLLARESDLPALAAADRVFLRDTLDRLRASIARWPAKMVPIHGDAHLGNVLITADGARWTDFEDACLGPREWDVGWLPETHLTRVEALDPDLLAALGYLRSLCVSVWCWEKYDIPEKREAAAYHLDFLKASCPFEEGRPRRH